MPRSSCRTFPAPAQLTTAAIITEQGGALHDRRRQYDRLRRNDESLFTAIRAGARGYLVKGADEEEIVRAIRVVASGDVVFGSAAGARALAYFTAAPCSGPCRSTVP